MRKKTAKVPGSLHCSRRAPQTAKIGLAVKLFVDACAEQLQHINRKQIGYAIKRKRARW